MLTDLPGDTTPRDLPAGDPLGPAIEVLARRHGLPQDAAAAALFDIADEIGVDVDDLARLVGDAAARAAETGTASV